MSKKILFLAISDLHLSEYKKFSTRENSGFRVLRIIAHKCHDLGVPAVHIGDLLHKPESITNEFFYRLVKNFKQLSRYNWKLYTISGNHCISRVSKIKERPISWDRSLAALFPWLKCIDYRKIDIGHVQIHGVPYIDHNIGISEYLKDMKLDKNRKHILMLHTDYPGAKDTDGTPVDSVENLNINTLSKFNLTLCGHIHKPQRLGKKVYMIGSPYQQRRTDKNCDLGYWEVYEDLTLKFIPLKDFPRFIDVESEDQVKHDGHYYTILPSNNHRPSDNNTPNMSKGLSTKTLVRRYMRHCGVKDKNKKHLLLKVLNDAE